MKGQVDQAKMIVVCWLVEVLQGVAHVKLNFSSPENIRNETQALLHTCSYLQIVYVYSTLTFDVQCTTK